jgi:hypothetical protein
MIPLADTILREWWKDLGVRQHHKGKKYHRALPAFHLGALFLGTLDHGMAFRWFLHTHYDVPLRQDRKRGISKVHGLLSCRYW